MNIEAKKAFARAELAIADYFFKRVQLASATGPVASGFTPLSVDGGSGLAKDNDPRMMPKIVEGLHAARRATADLEGIVQHRRSF